MQYLYIAVSDVRKSCVHLLEDVNKATKLRTRWHIVLDFFVMDGLKEIVEAFQNSNKQVIIVVVSEAEGKP